MTASAQLLRAAPYFPVADLDRAAGHYQTVLGFHLDYRGGSPAEFAILSRDGLPVMLKVVPDPARIRPNEAQGGTWDVFYWVRDARELHAELAGAGATVVTPPTLMPYHVLEFSVRDQDGHVLGVGQAVDA